MEIPHKAEGESVLDPCGDVTVDARSIAPRLESLEGTTIGFLADAKTNADHFLEDFVPVLEEV